MTKEPASLRNGDSISRSTAGAVHPEPRNQGVAGLVVPRMIEPLAGLARDHAEATRSPPVSGRHLSLWMNPHRAHASHPTRRGGQGILIRAKKKES